jgi:hypothetical protein
MAVQIVDTSQVTTATCNAREVSWVLSGSINWEPNNVYLSDYTDGYRIESRITPAATAANIMTGACAEYIAYIDGYADYKNGAICHAVVADATDSTKVAVNGNYVFLIPKASWVTGGGSLTAVTVSDVSTLKLTD